MAEVIDDTDEYTEEDDLLFSESPGMRVFILSDAGLKTVIGILLEETDDSFLVAMPARLIDVDGNKEMESVVDVPFFRLLKSNVSILMHGFEPFRKYYNEYLKDRAKDVYPPALDFVEDELPLSETRPDLEGPSSEESGNSGSSTSGKVVKLGMSDEELAEYLSKKTRR